MKKTEEKHCKTLKIPSKIWTNDSREVNNDSGIFNAKWKCFVTYKLTLFLTIIKQFYKNYYFCHFQMSVGLVKSKAITKVLNLG